MARAGDNGGVYHQLDESQHLFLDAWTTQMQLLPSKTSSLRSILDILIVLILLACPGTLAGQRSKIEEDKDTTKEDSINNLGNIRKMNLLNKSKV